MDSGIMTNPWLIATVAFLASQVGVPFINLIAHRVRARFGVFSGQYLALTGIPENGSILIESIRCRNIHERLTGTIKGIAVIPANEENSVASVIGNEAKYRFGGYVSERTLSVSYKSSKPRERSLGLIILKGDETGTVFSGQWAGSAGESLINTPCTWIRLDPPIATSLPTNEFVSASLNRLTNLETSLANSLKQALASPDAEKDIINLKAKSKCKEHIEAMIMRIREVLQNESKNG